jgi:hypothetical protein
MKKVFLILVLILTFIVGCTQTISNRSSGAVTTQDARLSALYNLLIPRYSDTTQANLTQYVGLDSCGAVIFTRSDNNVWKRNCNIKKWELVGGAASVNIYNSTTTGGTAIPFWASLRIKISSPSPIKKPGPSGKEEIVGVSVTAKVIKNRVDRPWRESSFDILFEEGIYEAENIFDIAREFCERNKETPILFEGKQISVAGASAWKEFNVVDNKTGEVIVSEKFYKPAFKDKILDNPQYASYVKALLDGVYVIAKDDTDHVTIGSAEPEIEKESATEM